jgi:hypothetical protein
MGSVKKKGPGTSLLQDMNFLSLKEFYNSIPGAKTFLMLFLIEFINENFTFL